MIFGLIVLLALAVLAPLLLVLRGRAATRGARGPALALHQTQLRELDRDLAEGRLLPAEHKIAVLEVQRRLLAAAGSEEAPPRTGARWPVIATAAVVPLVALGLYFASGSRPFLPSVSGSSPEAQAAQDALLIESLRQQLSAMDPTQERTRQGYLLLGTAESRRGDDRAAAEAFRMALRARFDPTVAAMAAEASTRADGGVTEANANLFRRALAAAPADAPWRGVVEERLKERRLP